MADISQTAANAHVYEGVRAPELVQFGETMVPGNFTYLKVSDSKWWKTDANTQLPASTRIGMVVVGAAGDAYGVVVTKGPVDVGGTLTSGVPYIASQTAGGIAPATDWSGYTSAYQIHLGYATGANTLDLDPKITGATI